MSILAPTPPTLEADIPSGVGREIGLDFDLALIQTIEAANVGETNEDLELSVAALTEVILDARQHDATLQLHLPRRFTSHSSAYDAIIDDYSVGPLRKVAAHRLEIPSGQISRAKVLAGDYGTGGVVHPLLDLSVQTSSDRPITTVNRETGQWESVQSPGRWYRFALREVRIGLVEN